MYLRDLHRVTRGDSEQKCASNRFRFVQSVCTIVVAATQSKLSALASAVPRATARATSALGIHSNERRARMY